ncbi:phosphotransferase [Kribbella sp. NPDC051718]|uniref:phosphotransferase enzyme family protein n=1 Tax=Kribbella sp. NPDC051718 TaxID=3155168 RepID=UPI00343159DB
MRSSKALSADPITPLVAGARSALERAAATIGLDLADAELAHCGHNVGFTLPGAGLFARVGPPGSQDKARNAVVCSRYFHQQNLPVVPPIEGRHALASTAYGPVTFWPLLHPVDAPVDFRWLGRTLRRLHDLPGRGMPPAQRTSRRDLGSRVGRFLQSRPDPSVRRKIEALVRELDECALVLPTLAVGPVHGDPYPSNVLATAAGYRLLDYDGSGIGHQLLDLAPIFAAHKRFGLGQADLKAFVDGYGSDPRALPEFGAVLRLRELGLVTWLLKFAGHLEAYYDELEWRLATLDSTDDWTDLGHGVVDAAGATEGSACRM